MARIKIKNMAASDPRLDFTLSVGADDAQPQDSSNPKIALVAGKFTVEIHVFNMDTANSTKGHKTLDAEHAVEHIQLGSVEHSYSGAAEEVDCSIDYTDEHYFEGVDLMAKIKISQGTNSVMIDYPPMFTGGA